MSKSLWGPPCWSMMHVLATRIKKEEFENKTSMRDDLFDSLSILRDTYSEEKEDLIQK